MKRKSKYPRLRVFLNNCMATFSIFFLCAGFLIADYNSRNTGFGTASMRIDAFAQNGILTVNFLGKEKEIQIPDQVSKWAGRIWNLLPPHFRAVFWILEGEYDAVPRVLEYI